MFRSYVSLCILLYLQICGVLAHVVDNRKTLVLRGARVSKEHVGMGIFRTLHKCIVDEFLSYGTLQKAITFNNENMDMINQVKKGNYRLIMEKVSYKVTTHYIYSKNP